MKRLRLHVLGGFQVTVDDQPITGFEADTARALLAYLALNTAYPHRRENIAQLLWANQPRESALVNMRSALNRVRHALSDKDTELPIVLAGRQDIQINPHVDIWVDIREVERLLAEVKNHSHRHVLGCAWCRTRLTQIDDLYRGEFLNGLFVDSLPFEEWQTARREEMHHLVVQVFATLAALHYTTGAYDEAERYSRRELALEPWNEEAHQRLMRALFASGRRSAALAQYNACRTRLRDDLGVEPSEETTALYHEIAAAPRQQNRSARAPFSPSERNTSRALGRLPAPDDRSQEYNGSAAQLAAERATRGSGDDDEARHHNLPEPSTSFVGRRHELATLARLLGTTRLLTLTGPGGAGKTRLSLAFARAVREQFSAGVWLVELASLADSALVLPTLAGALGLREELEGQSLKRLASFMGEKQLLLVLDNCEHLIDTCAYLAEQLLAACPHLKILASSREPLRIAGEALFQVSALSVPSPRWRPSADELSQYEAVQLFLERARMVSATFELTEANAASVAQICTQLDGIPLAIELAAARLRMLTVAQIAARLGERFRLLTSGSRTVLPRHQTLQALIDWSYNLLSEQERALLHYLSVFAGGWTLEAVEAVCASAAVENVLSALAHLVDKSMVQVEPGNEGIRYRMLETIRQYALEKLEASGQADAVRRQHVSYYLALAEMAEEHILWRTNRQTEWLVKLEIEHDNLRAALSFCIQPLEAEQGAAGAQQLGERASAAMTLAELGVRLAAALGTFWDTRRNLSEGRAWLARALAQSQPIAPTVRARALNQAGRLAWLHDDTGTARELYQESLRLLRTLDRQDETASVVYNLGQMALAQGDLGLAAGLFEEALSLRRLLGDTARFQGEYARATALVHEALTLFESFGDLGGIAYCKWALGHTARSEGDDGVGAEHYGQALALAQKIGDGLLIASTEKLLRGG